VKILVYVLTSEPYHDNSTVIGVYHSLDAAIAAHPADWQRDGFYIDHWPHCVAQAAVDMEHRQDCADALLVFEHEVQP
jgi:hypothetical protein